MVAKMFLNLPVADLAASRAFYIALGFSIDENFSGEQSATVVVSDTIYLVLLTRDYFATYIETEVADARTSTEAMIGLAADSREAVDLLVDAAYGAGATAARETHDYGFMYTRSFCDPDGHFWEAFWMADQAAQSGPPERFTAAGERIEA